MNGHVSDIKAWLKLKLIASSQLSLLLEMKVGGLADILLPVFVLGIISILTQTIELKATKMFSGRSSLLVLQDDTAVNIESR